MLFTHEYFMRQALLLAREAAQADEIPVGAVVVCQNRIVGKGYNQTERLHDITAHAELIALTAAANHLSSKYLNQCTLYVTLEPCPMCAGALAWAQLGALVYGAEDEKRGFSRFQPGLLHPKTQIVKGIEAEHCAELLRSFFADKRK